ncbi:MAG: S9 family peptidase, partial [Gemmatimonadota bacterium]
MKRSRIVGVAVAVSLVSAGGASGQDVEGMPTFREALSLDGVGQVAVSPDGSMVAYTVRSVDWDDNGYDTEIWLASADRAPVQLTRTAEGSSGAPQWSPDGRWLAFTADRGDESQVHLISPLGGEAFPVTEVEGGVSGFQWSPDGDRMMLLVGEPESDESKTRKERYGAFEIDGETDPSSHLWVVDVDPSGRPGEPERRTEGDFHVTSFRWSPDGTRVAYVRQADASLLASLDTDIWLLDVASGESRGLVTAEGPDDDPRWSPDGAWILFSEFDRDLGSFFYLNRELARVSADGGPPEVLTRDFDEQPAVVAWTPQGIRFVASARTERKVFTLDPDTRRIRELSLSSPIVGSVSFTPDGTALAYTGSSGSTLSEVFLARADHAGEAIRLTEMTAQTNGWDVGTREVVTWTSEDGAEIEGVLYKPSDFDASRRYPLLVVIHGGPTGTSRPTMLPSYVYPIAHWVAKGAVVLEPNYRGSAGYGEAFRSLNVRNLGVGDMWDVMSGVEALVDQGIADPERMGAMGWSQGGYISAFLTTNTDAFQAISVGAGISNWMTYYVNTDIHPFTRQYLKGTPWSDPEVYA